MEEGNLLLFGASTRAAAFSALRAGLRPWCFDLFADADLQAHCPVMRLRGRYPQGFLDLIEVDVPGPWLYTGGLENWPALVGRMARCRPLWGNDESTLQRIRSPQVWTRTVKDAGLPVPDCRLSPPDQQDLSCWLVKPLRGAGGAKIRFWNQGEMPGKKYFLQEYIEGQPVSALFTAIDGQAQLLGVTQQLVGEPWLHAAAFSYCGSVGPLSLNARLHQQLLRLGEILTISFGLRGLFGVDGVLCGDDFYPVEINPRYTASVEVLEWALDLRALAWHRRAFVPTVLSALPVVPSRIIGKAILFAQGSMVFPKDGPWREAVCGNSTLDQPPWYADVPHPGERLEAGRPVLTFFAQAESVSACRDALHQRAEELDQRFFSC